MEIVVPVFLRSLQIHNTLKAMGLSNLQNRTKHITAYEQAVINYCSDCDINILEEKFSTYGLTLVLAPHDAAAMNLLSDLTAWEHSFHLAGIEHHEDLTVEAVSGSYDKFSSTRFSGNVCQNMKHLSVTQTRIMKRKQVNFKNVDTLTVNLATLCP